MEFDIKEIHKINQYLYDNNINLPKSQKTLFIASILICLKINNKFIDDFNKDSIGYIIADKMIDTIQTFYKDIPFAQSFNFIKNSIHNDNLYELFRKLKKLVKIHDVDILNLFYSEFCIYDRNNDGELGIVLTPDDIVDLMIKELNIIPTDSVCDFCTGTGSFLIKASKYSKNLIGCENNEERYSLAKCNFILHDLKFSELYNNSCFTQKFKKYDKVIINPPFGCASTESKIELSKTNWKEFSGEQKFILYQIQLLKNNGIGACIIPRNNINNSTKKSNRFKQEILNYCQILKIINCNSNVFMPNAQVECAILIFKKCNNKSINVKIIDYTDDGYEINNNLRLKKKKEVFIEQIRDLNYSDDWNFQKEIILDISIQYLINEYNNDYNYVINKLKNDTQKNYKLVDVEAIENDIITEWQNLKISDCFDIIKVDKKFKINNTEIGKYPLISSSGLDGGIAKYINDYSHDGECLSVARNGTVGSCFYQKDKIGITGDVILIKFKEDAEYQNYHVWAMIMNYILPKKYSYSNKLSIDKLLNETITIPILFNEN